MMLGDFDVTTLWSYGWMAVAWFVTFIVMLSIVFLNLLIAIISDEFERFMEGRAAAGTLAHAKLCIPAILDSSNMLQTNLKNLPCRMLIVRQKSQDASGPVGPFQNPIFDEQSTDDQAWAGRTAAVKAAVVESSKASAERFDRVQSEVAAMKKLHVEFAETSAERFKRVQSEVAAMKGEVAAVKGEVAAMKGEVAAVKGEVVTIKESNQSMEAKLDQLLKVSLGCSIIPIVPVTTFVSMAQHHFEECLRMP